MQSAERQSFLRRFSQAHPSLVRLTQQERTSAIPVKYGLRSYWVNKSRSTTNESEPTLEPALKRGGPEAWTVHYLAPALFSSKSNQH
jgi:hypothetical protein